MAVIVRSGAVCGVEAIPISVEVDLLKRLPAMCIVGLAAGAVKESAERIRSAIESIGEAFPRKRIVVNLAPADVRKEGSALDLPIALAILASDGRIPADSVGGVLAVGELSLGGDLREVRGALPLAMLARREGKTLVVPRSCAASAGLVPGVAVVGAAHLSEVVAWLRGERAPAPVEPPAPAADPLAPRLDLADVRGQEIARGALEIAAAGAHHLLMIGPPGCGKSMLARRLPSILPPLSFEESLETTLVHSAAGLLVQEALLVERPFRAPHHSVTVAGLVGDQTLRPGEISLAHNGVLFLDEAAEFSRIALEVLRQPLEEGVVRLSRARGSVEYPAEITLVLACNPCPCGQRGAGACRCPDSVVTRYLGKLSGPVLDRVDLHIDVQPVSPQTRLDGRPGESSASVRRRVLAARERAARRGQRRPNGRLSDSEIERFASATRGALSRLVDGASAHGLSGRAMGRLLRVARTLADLEGSDAIEEPHIALSLGMRPGIVS